MQDTARKNIIALTFLKRTTPSWETSNFVKTASSEVMPKGMSSTASAAFLYAWAPSDSTFYVQRLVRVILTKKPKRYSKNLGLKIVLQFSIVEFCGMEHST